VAIGRNYGRNEWNEDMKKVLKYAGCEGKPITFFLSDNQITNESFVEDISMLLNIGDIPNLYQSEERIDILDKVSNIAQSQVCYIFLKVNFYKNVCYIIYSENNKT
jgi:dynein heavy chain